ncbi:SH3 domain-binding protein 2 isoform X2 [Antennarius striatus]|uniref:SH3 domain-binding protein 2 isoform X2 n=1 Tax=Antennarius striatus TaxID=241820 RepID=UPI0035B48F6A
MTFNQLNPDRKASRLTPAWSLFHNFVMDLVPALASTVLASAVSRLRESAAVQVITRRLNGRTMSSPQVCWPVPMRAIGAQNLLTMPGGVSIAGYLHKKGGSQFSLMKWPLRYTIIHKGCIYYFKSSTSPAPQGAFSLNGYNRVMRAAEETTSSNVFPFKIVHFSKKHRTWFFSAASEDERRKWMRYLRREIDHYNDRKDCHISSDSDSDADSFYGTIERPLNITHPVDNTEDDYVEDDDDDDDEEDYLKPDSDSSPTSTGRPTGPPPSYPPPPVPAQCLPREDFSSASQKGRPPLPPPISVQHRISAIPKKAPPSVPPPPILRDPSKGPPLPHPFTDHLHKSLASTPPPPPPPNAKRTPHNRTAFIGGPRDGKTDRRNPPTISMKSPISLPISDQLETRMVLNGPIHCPLNAEGNQPLGNIHHGMASDHSSKPSLRSAANLEELSTRPVMFDSLFVNQTSPSHPPRPGHPPLSPSLRTGLHNKPEIQKPPLLTGKPQLTAAHIRQPGTPLQASPEGQSFRSLTGVAPSELRRKQESAKSEGEESDDDYENVQLPDSVFIDSTETSFVEKLFRENPVPPQDGLYAIRKSGTKTAKVLVVWDVRIGKARNYRLFEENDNIFLDSDMTFPTLPALVEHYFSHPLPHHGSLCLQKPYSKRQST